MNSAFTLACGNNPDLSWLISAVKVSQSCGSELVRVKFYLDLFKDSLDRTYFTHHFIL